jgi:CheY-like chemotaxis protein
MKPLLLVVENDSGTRRLLDVFLRRQELEVDPVATGSEALLLLDRIDYAAVVLDLLIPGRTGRDVLDEIAARRPELLERIVVISSATEAHLRDVRGSYPAVAALRKPFDLNELLAHVQQRVARHVVSRPVDAAQSFVRLSVTAGARAGVIVRHTGETLDLMTSFGYPPGMAEGFYPLAIDAQFPLCAAARHRRAVWMSTLQAPAAAEYPLLMSIWREYGSFALAAVPIIEGDRVTGVAGWSFSEQRVFNEEERARLIAIAEGAAELIGGSSTTASSRRA